MVTHSKGPANDPAEPAPLDRFRTLPEPVRPEDMIATQEAAPARVLAQGGDPDTDWLLRNAG